MQERESRTWRVPEGPAERLDRALVRAFPDLSRSRVQALLAEGHAQVDGAVEKPSFKVISGQVLTIDQPQTVAKDPRVVTAYLGERRVDRKGNANAKDR